MFKRSAVSSRKEKTFSNMKKANKGDIKILRGGFSKELDLQFAPGIRAEFPSPAEDYLHDTLDFNRDLL